jgi:uncharacterized membrane protein
MYSVSCHLEEVENRAHYACVNSGIIGRDVMPQLAQWFFRAAVVFLIIGIMMGLQMSISGVYNVTGAHAHTNLLGWVTSALFGTFYALNPAKAELKLARVHFWLHTVSVAIMTPSLYLAFLGYSAFEPLLGVLAIAAFASVLLFAWIVFRPAEEKSSTRGAVPAE